MPEWITSDDPWLSTAMRHSTRIATHETALLDAVVEAMAEFLRLARVAVLDHQTPEGTTVAAGHELPPNLDGFPTQQQWVALLSAYTSEPLGAAFGEAFAQFMRTADVSAEPYRAAWMATVPDRLSQNLWPAGVFEELRYELQEAHQHGESIDRVRDRVGMVLDIDAPSREIRARINEHRRLGEQVPSSLWRAEREADRAWHYPARRIARTETVAAFNAGTHDAGQAWVEVSGQTLFKMWLATSDTRVRNSHWAAHRQVRAADETFDVGGHALDHPGASGPPEVTIQCRCTVLWLDEQEADEARARYEAELPNRTDNQGRPLVTATATTPTAVTWEGPLCPLGAASGDGRVIGPPEGDGAPRVVDQPWLSYQREASMGHDGKIAVGRIEEVWIDGHTLDGTATPHLWARGTFDAADPDAPEVIRKIVDGYAGTVSVDLDDAAGEERWITPDGGETDPPDEAEMDRWFDGEDIGKRPVEWATDWRLAGVTLVQDPAFHTGHITLTEPATTAAASGKAGLPLAGSDVSWDASGAATRLAEAGKLADGHFWRDPEGDPEAQTSFKLPFADMVDGTLTAVPAGVHAAAAAVQGARGGVSIPESDVDAVKSKIGGYYSAMDETPPWQQDSGENSTTASGSGRGSRAERIAAAVPHEPPAGWFTDPQLSGPTKVRVGDDGRVFGHLAAWGTSHAALPGQQPPRCPEGGSYPKFHRHGVVCADGSRVLTGPLATSGHASTDRGVTMSAAMAHYDDPNYIVADVVVGEDTHGIWCSGALRPGVSAMQVLAADRYSFSGDWREGGYLVAACSVSVPGFHLTDDADVHALAATADEGRLVLADARTRRRADADGHTHALVAAGVLRHQQRTQPRPAEDVGLPRNGWDFYRQFRDAQRAHERVDAARARVAGYAVAAAADRIATIRTGD